MTVLWLAVIAVCIIADQVIKLWAISSLKSLGTIPLIDEVFHLTYVENHGAAFSILQNKTIFLIVITSVALLIAAFLLFKGKIKGTILQTSVALIISGGIGNLIDRIRLGFVVDYLDFRLINFPVFNLADCFVVVGTFLLLFYELFLSKEETTKKQDKTIVGEEN